MSRHDVSTATVHRMLRSYIGLGKINYILLRLLISSLIFTDHSLS